VRYTCVASRCSRVNSAITAAVMTTTTLGDAPGLSGTGKTSTAIAKYSSFVMFFRGVRDDLRLRRKKRS
jgi:hypothetical protein